MMGLADTLKVQPDQLSDRVARMIAQLKEAEREIAALKSANLLAGLDAITAKTKDMWGIGYIAHRADGVTGNDLRTLVQEVRNKVANQTAVICVIGGTADKPAVVVATTEGARHRGVKAGELVTLAAKALGGRGGGKDDLAQGGGTDAAGIDQAFTDVEHAIGAIATR